MSIYEEILDYPSSPYDEGAPCEFCGDVRFVDVFEIFTADRAFLFETCCLASHEQWVEEMNGWARETWRAFFLARADLDLRDVVDEFAGGGQFTLDYGLRLGEVSLSEAKEFVRRHHRHNRPPCGWRWGHGCFNGEDLVAVAMVGRPVARRLDHETIVEVNRLCVDHSLPGGLVWNACSMLYAAAAREASRRGFERIITYTLEEERGTALKASSWTAVATTRGGSWNRPSRSREDTAPTCRKVRWERRLAVRSKESTRA